MIWQEECDRFLYYLDQVITAIPNLLDPETLAFFKEFVPIVDEDLNPINIDDLSEQELNDLVTSRQRQQDNLADLFTIFQMQMSEQNPEVQELYDELFETVQRHAANEKA